MDIGQGLGKIDYRYWIFWQVEVLVLQTPEVAASLVIRSITQSTSGQSDETVVGPPKKGAGDAAREERMPFLILLFHHPNSTSTPRSETLLLIEEWSGQNGFDQMHYL